ncbi:hypothetical protein UFOVP1596_8 [uncultured Caudovirales phage]|uniref:Uncharacterized protein n=1 Tax=uncultured Caudovirales phage TaxID=2100421 RepID=A0A6J5SSK2_9CAUD|nr:hypothetical protein UFOVP1596_8 [uncultured Caudovirales phage]
MLRLISEITITQQANDLYSNRAKIFTLDFVNECEIVSTWQNLTTTAKLKFPRNIYVIDETGHRFPWTGKEITQSTSGPLFMRGDKVSIKLGYIYDDFKGTETTQLNEIFSGWISFVKNKMPVEIQCEDNMWKLKRIMCPNKFFPGSSYTVEKIITEVLGSVQGAGGSAITVRDGVSGVVKLNVGDVRTQNETVCELLERLAKDGGIHSYFRGDELRCSGIVYYPDDRVEEIFAFQNNIISDDLEYRRKEELNVAIKARSFINENSSGTNQDGSDKKKTTRLEVLVGPNGEIPEHSFSGSKVEQIFLGAKTKEELIKRAKLALPHVWYTGWFGSFLTFGQPTVRHGDAVVLRDNVLPERNGKYLIKQVDTTFGVKGFRQKVTLHLRIDQGYTVQEINAGL